MHAMFQRAAVTTGALSALLGLAGSPCWAAAASHAVQTPVGSEAADRTHQPAGPSQPTGTTHRPGTEAEGGTQQTATPPRATPRETQDTWTCSASLDAWDDAYQCPDLPSGFYTFKNTSPGNDGIYVYICNAYPNADSCAAPGSGFYLNDPGDTQNAAVPPGYDVYIEGADLVEHEQLELSATPYTSDSRAPREPGS